MPSKKKKYNARFPPARIKKIMQTDEEVGKVAAAVPVIISRALELFIESLIIKSSETTQARNARTLSTAHIKHIIQSEKKFDFLRDLVANIPDIQQNEDDNADLRPVADTSEAPAAVRVAAVPPPPRPKPRTAPAPTSEGASDGQPVKRPRGRPRKIRPPAPEEQLPPKKRGRKKKVPEVEVEVEEKKENSPAEDANSDNETESADEGSDDNEKPEASNNNSLDNNRLNIPVERTAAAATVTGADQPEVTEENVSIMPPHPASTSEETKGENTKPGCHTYNENSGSVQSESTAAEAHPADFRMHPGRMHPLGLPYYGPAGPGGEHPACPPPQMYPHRGHMPPMPPPYPPHPHHPGTPSALNNSIPPPMSPSFPSQALPYPPPMSFYGSYPQPSDPALQEHKVSSEPKDFGS